jgi:hypothetical protein
MEVVVSFPGNSIETKILSPVLKTGFLVRGITIKNNPLGPCWCYSPTRIRAGKELRVLLGHKSYGQVTRIPDYLLATFIALVGEEHQRGRTVVVSADNT